MSDYTPNTEKVRETWVSRYDGEHTYADREERSEYVREFDRWLAEHDAEVAKIERAWILALLEGKQDWAVSDVLALIKGENE